MHPALFSETRRIAYVTHIANAQVSGSAAERRRVGPGAVRRELFGTGQDHAQDVPGDWV